MIYPADLNVGIMSFSTNAWDEIFFIQLLIMGKLQRNNGPCAFLRRECKD